MKDSQKKKAKQRKKVNNSPVSVKKTEKFPTPSIAQTKAYIRELYISAKKQFFWIIAIITVTNLLLGIGVVYLLGKTGESILPQQFSDINIPNLPVLSEPPELNITAESFIVYEKDSRSIVFEKRGSLRFSPASSTKIMTALVALESYDLQTYLRSDGVSSVRGSNMGLVEGEELRVQDLLYGLMLPSGNDAAYVLAHNYPGGRAAFIEQMNQKARSMHLDNTYFVDPAGLEDENYTTAFDLARLALFALENEEFKKIVETRQITVYDKTFTHVHHLENLNKLLNKEGVFGVKTGFTDEAGQVLVTSFDSKGKTYIIVVLKSKDRFWDTEQIINEVIENIYLENY